MCKYYLEHPRKRFVEKKKREKNVFLRKRLVTIIDLLEGL